MVPFPGRRWCPAPGGRGRFASVATLTAALLLGASLAARPAAAQQPLQQGDSIRTVQLELLTVAGNERLRPEVILSETGLAEGTVITLADVQRALHRLWSLGQFSDVTAAVRPLAEGADAPVELVFTVEERPFVAAIEFRGLESVKGGTVRDTVDLRAGLPLAPARVTAAEEMTRELLADKGIWLRAITHRLEPIPDRPGENRLIFEVEEGNRVAIADVIFEGNSVLSDDDLRSAIGTKQEGFFWFREGKYDEEQLREDLREKLPQAYGELGYIDFAVTGDSLAVDRETGKARLVVAVEEGERYLLAEFDVAGNRRFSADELRRYFETQSGGLLQNLGISRGPAQQAQTPFDAAAFQDATQRVRQLYNNHGYLYAQVEPIIEKTETADGSPAVSVAWQIREGEPAYINRVQVVGNTYTHEDVIRDRIMLLPGDVYSEELLIQSYQAISGLGFFETPMPMPEIKPTDDGNVDIVFQVDEKQTGSVNFGTAIGGYGGLSGFLGYDQPNLFGQAKSGHLRWEFGRYSNNFEASYTDPSIKGTLYSGSLSLFTTKNSFGRAFRFSEGEFRRTGTALRFGFPLPNDRWSRMTVGYSVVNTTYSDFDRQSTTSLFQLPNALQSSLSLGLQRNTLNHTLFPTSGTRHELEAAFSGGPLGGDGEFQKYTAAASWYVPVGQVGGDAPGARPIRFTLGLSAEVGALFGDATLFPFERFWLGGVQFGRPLRGYDETTVTPLGYFPRDARTIPLESRLGDAYLRLSAEYAVRLNDNLSGSLFFDAGNIWNDPLAINPTRLFRGAGLGVTLVTPFGPLGLDYAYGFDRTDPGWQLHFKMGPTF